MQIIVPDASLLIKWLLPHGTEPDQLKAATLRDAVVDGDVTVKLPALWLYEVSNTLGRKFPNQAEEMMQALFMLGFEECSWSLPWLRQALSLMRDYGVTFYDAAYHALAIVEKGIFVTADGNYLKKVTGAKAVVALSDWELV